MVTHQLKIHEIFYSIQGESLFAGKPTVFVRLSTCNLRCTYCDTRYAFWKGSVMGLEEILKRVKSHPTRYVCVTGGEPLGQSGVYPLMEKLLKEGYTVSLETNGSFLTDRVPREVIKVLDLKTPESGEVEANEMRCLDYLNAQDQVKFVVASQKDFEWATEICQAHRLWEKCSVLFSPVHDQVSPKDLASWVLSAPFPATMQMQMHKEIWGASIRGV